MTEYANVQDHPCLADMESVEPTRAELDALAAVYEEADAAAGFTVSTSLRSANYGPNSMAKPSGIILHHTAGTETSDVPTLTRPGTGVSSNDYITKQGRIMELVPFPRRAWHAGTRDASQAGKYFYDGNTNYWGIEIENRGNGSDPYPKAQVDAVIWRCRRLKEKWGLYDPSQIFRHRDFAPSRKSDTSNNFPFEEVRRRIMAKTDAVDGGSTPAPPKPPDPKPPSGVVLVRIKSALPAGKAIHKLSEAEAKKEQARLLKNHGIETTVEESKAPN